MLVKGTISAVKGNRVSVFFPEYDIVSRELPVLRLAHNSSFELKANYPVACLMCQDLTDGICLGLYEYDDDAARDTPGFAVNEFEITSGQTIVKIEPTGIKIGNNTESLKLILQDLITQVSLITIASFGTPPANAPAITALITRLNSILK